MHSPARWALRVSLPSSMLHRHLPSQQTCNDNFGLRLWSSGKALSAADLQRVRSRQAETDASGTRPGITRLTIQLIKKSYLMTSKHLTDLVDQAQVDEKSKLQLRFYARQFIDAMSPSNFPATNPEVIRTAIQTRSASLTDRDEEFDRRSSKGAHHAGRRIRF